jgi:hypothetical protein
MWRFLDSHENYQLKSNNFEFDPIPMEWKELKSEKGTPPHPELKKIKWQKILQMQYQSVSILRLPHSA